MSLMLIASMLVALAVLAHCAVLGTGLMRGLSYEPPWGGGVGALALAAFFAISLGMLVNMLALAGLGLTGHLTLQAVGGTAVALLVAAGVAMAPRKHGGSGPNALHHAAPSWAEMATLGIILVLCGVVSMHPPGHWDDTMYQLPLARHYVEHHAVVLNEYLRFPLFPQHENMLFALGMMLGDLIQPWLVTNADNPSTQLDALWHFGAPEVLAQLFATLPLFVMALGLWGASHHYLGSGVPGLIAGLTLFMIGPVVSTLGFAYVDNALALYCWAAALAVALAAGRRYAADWAIAGLLAGAACGIKYFGVIVAAGLGIMVMLMVARQHRPTTVLRAAAIYGMAVLAAGGLWYLRNYLVSGDPAHPTVAWLFGYFLWNEDDLARQHAEQAMYGVGRNPLLLPAALREAGALSWVPAIAGIFIRRLPKGIRLLQATFIGYLLFWFIVTQVPRYLAPVYGVAGFLTLHALWFAWRWIADRVRKRRTRGAWPRKDASSRPARSFGLLPMAVILLASLTYLVDRGSKYSREFLEAETVLATNVSYTLYQHANLNAEQFGHRIVQVGFEDGIYFFQGTVIGDWFGPGRYRDLLQCDALPCPLPPMQELRNTLREHGARMLLLNRALVIGLDDEALHAAGWLILATSEHGVLLATRPLPFSPARGGTADSAMSGS